MGEKLVEVLEGIAGATDLVAAAIVLIGFGRGVVAFAQAEAGPGRRRWDNLQNVRCTLGTYLLLGIEFMIISDLLHSCVHRSLENLYELGLLVVIRTVISYFLGKELESIHKTEVTD